MRTWTLTPFVLLLACPVDPEGGGPGGTEPTPDPVDAPGCEPLTLVEADVCDENEQPTEPWLDLEDPCPDFWDAADIDGGDWEVVTDSYRVGLDGATVEAPYTAFELRQRYRSDDQYTVLDVSGTLCADATDAGACEAALEALEPVAELEGVRSTCDRDCWWTYWVWTRGDDVGLLNTPEALHDYLGPIDSVADAALQVYGQTALTWGGDELRRSAAREVADGWEVIGRSIVWGWPVRTDRFRMHVTRDGVVTEVDRAVDRVDCGMILGR